MRELTQQLKDTEDRAEEAERRVKQLEHVNEQLESESVFITSHSLNDRVIIILPCNCQHMITYVTLISFLARRLGNCWRKLRTSQKRTGGDPGRTQLNLRKLFPASNQLLFFFFCSVLMYVLSCSSKKTALKKSFFFAESAVITCKFDWTVELFYYIRSF